MRLYRMDPVGSAGSRPLTRLDAARQLPQLRPTAAAFLKDLLRVTARAWFRKLKEEMFPAGSVVPRVEIGAKLCAMDCVLGRFVAVCASLFCSTY
jgi:hypothetical protein